MTKTEAIATTLIVGLSAFVSMSSVPEDRRTRLVGYGCTEGNVVQHHDEEDLFPPCHAIEANR